MVDVEGAPNENLADADDAPNENPADEAVGVAAAAED